ncbi:transcriptional repressor general negative regulator of transcription subunit 4 [Thecaphora frezii]
MAKRTAPQTSTAGPAFPPLGLVAGPGAPGVAALSMNGMSNSYSNAGSAASSSEPPIHSNGLPPAPNKFDVSQAQQCRLQDAYWSDEEEDMDCPLCLEEIDLSDANFKPCPCGYQICRFCWHHIKQNLNGRCPACRRKYSDQTVEFKPMTAEEIKKLTQAKKQKEREKKELEAMNRKHLANMRVVQKNLVYVVGLSSKLAKEELIPTLRSNDYFGQYGRISKILISKRTTASKLVMGTSESAIGVYVTYHRKEDAAKAIVAIDGSKGSDGKVIRASYGTTKYCTTYLRNLPCTNPGCTYLHEPGEEADSFTKEDLSTLRHAAKDTENKIKPASMGLTAIPKRTDSAAGSDSLEGSALPKTASWASGKPVAGLAPGAPMVGSPFRESDMPPLSASSASVLARKPSGPKPERQKSSSTKTPSTPTPKARAAAAAAVAAAARAESPVPVAPSTRPATPSPLAAAETTFLPSPPAKRSATPTPPPSAGPPPGLEQKPSAPAAQAKSSTESSRQTTPSGPPGLMKSSVPPPGLTSPATASTRTLTSEEGERTEKSSSTTAPSTYQPSLSAQALLDDMLQRREAEPEITKPSPFPDFDDALSSFQDGDFSFNFPAAQQAASANGSDASSSLRPGQVDLTTAFTTFSPFGAPPGVLAAHSGLVTAGTPPPGIMRTPNRSATASPAPLSYSGSFDPFAPGAGETIVEESNDKHSSPFGAIEQMKRTMSEEKNHNADGSGNCNEDAAEASDASKRASRFDFAKRKESDSLGAGIAGSPLRAELMLNMRANGFGDQDAMSLSKDTSSLLGSVFEQDVTHLQPQNGLTGFAESGLPGFALGRDGGYPGMGLSRPPGINSPAFNNRFSTNTPPPGISAPASRQQQALLASLHQMSGVSLSSPAESMQHMPNGSGASFLAELQQQAAQRAQQQAQFAAGNHGSPLVEHGRLNGSASSSDPLLAQIMAASGRRSGFGQQNHRDAFSALTPSELPFSDPAIMSMTRSQMQQVQVAHHHHQQHQQQQHQQQYGGRAGGYGGGFGNGGGSTFSAFDQLASFGGNSGPQHGFNDQRFLQQGQPGGGQQQQQQQQQQQHDHRSPYPALS